MHNTVSSAVTAKGFQLRPLGKRGELAQGREAAFSHPAEAPTGEILHCTNFGQQP